MPEINIDFNQYELFDVKTKAILAALLLQERSASNKPITLSRKKDFLKTVSYNEETYSVTLSHSINLYPAENNELQFEVLGHTADPRYTAAKMRSKDIVSYREEGFELSSVDGVLSKALETVVVKKVILQGQMNGGDLTLTEPSQPRVHKSQKIALKGKFLPKVVEDIFYQAANEVDINSKIYPDTSSLFFKQRTDESKKTGVIKTGFSMPYLAGKTFGQIIDEIKDKLSEPIPFEKILQMINAFLKAMQQLEEKEVVHCDLHTNNVLFDEQAQVAHIIDFDNAFMEGVKVIPTKHAAYYVAYEVNDAMQHGDKLIVDRANHIFSVARIVDDLLNRTITFCFVQEIEEQIVKCEAELLKPGLSALEKRPALNKWIEFFENFQKEYEKIQQEKTQKLLSPEIDVVLQLDELFSFEADLNVLHTLIQQEIDKSENQNKLDRKKTYQINGQNIQLSHSIVRHTDAAGNVFYDVYARDNDIDEEKIRYANFRYRAAKKNVLGIDSFGKVKPIIGRFFEKDGKLVQIHDPGLVTKIMQEHPNSKLEDYEQEASMASKSYRAVSQILQRPSKKGNQVFDYVMPYFPVEFLQKMRRENSEERPDVDEVITFFSDLRVAYSPKNSDEQIEVKDKDLKAIYSNPSIYIKKLEILVKNIESILEDITAIEKRLLDRLFERVVARNNPDYQETEDQKKLISIDQDKYSAFVSMRNNLKDKKIEIEGKIKEFNEKLTQKDKQVFTPETNLEHQSLFNNCKTFFETSIKSVVGIVSLKTEENKRIEKHVRKSFIWRLLRKIFTSFKDSESAKTLLKAENDLREIDPDVMDAIDQSDPAPTPTYQIG